MSLQLNNLSFTYRKRPVKALDGVTATIEPGIYLLLGPNGSGKTTLLHAMCGLLPVREGQCLIDGLNPLTHNPALMQKIAFAGVNTAMPQDNIRQMVKRHAVYYPTFSAATLETCLKTFGLEANQAFKTMSAGTFQKAAVSYALSLHTPYLFLDEPMATLDIESKNHMLQLLAEHTQPEQTVIVSTHTIADMGNIFDGVAFMRRGRLLTVAYGDAVMERLAFVDGMQPHASALYSHFDAGVWRSVVARAEEMPMTRPNWRLLYMALQQDNNNTILEILNR